jgi:hypothetical protein
MKAGKAQRLLRGYCNAPIALSFLPGLRRARRGRWGHVGPAVQMSHKIILDTALENGSRYTLSLCLVETSTVSSGSYSACHLS